MGFGASYAGGGLKSVQSFTITPSAAVTGVFTLGTAVDMATSRIVLAGQQGGNAADANDAFRVRLISSTVVEAIRTTGTASGVAIVINGYVEEFKAGSVKSIQRGTIDVTANGGTYNVTKTVNSVNTSKTSLSHLGMSRAGASPTSMPAKIKINSSTQIEADASASGTVGTVSYELVEFN